MNDSDAADLLWKEWQYRHGVFWSSFYRWGAAATAVSIVPYVKPDILDRLYSAVFVFPIGAWLLAMAAAWHLGAEYIRLLAVSERYDELRAQFAPPRLLNAPWWKKPFLWRIGWVSCGFFAIGFTVISILNAVVLMELIDPRAVLTLRYCVTIHGI